MNKELVYHTNSNLIFLKKKGKGKTKAKAKNGRKENKLNFYFVKFYNVINFFFSSVSFNIKCIRVNSTIF